MRRRRSLPTYHGGPEIRIPRKRAKRGLRQSGDKRNKSGPVRILMLNGQKIQNPEPPAESLVTAGQIASGAGLMRSASVATTPKSNASAETSRSAADPTARRASGQGKPGDHQTTCVFTYENRQGQRKAGQDAHYVPVDSSIRPSGTPPTSVINKFALT